MRQFQISVFTSETDNDPSLQSMTWEQLSAALTEHTPRQHKSGPAWSPARFSGLRSLANVRAVSLLVYDLDHSDPADLSSPPPTDDQLRDMAMALDAAGVACLAHESWSSGRWRLVIPLASDVPAHEFAGLWADVRDSFAIPADLAATDPSRLYFTPSHPPGEQRAASVSPGVFLSSNTGNIVTERLTRSSDPLQSHENTTTLKPPPPPERRPDIFPGNLDRRNSEKGTHLEADNFPGSLDGANSEKGTQPEDIEQLRIDVSTKGGQSTRGQTRAFVDCTLHLKKGARNATFFKIIRHLFDNATHLPSDELIEHCFHQAFVRMEGHEGENEAKWQREVMVMAAKSRAEAEAKRRQSRMLEGVIFPTPGRPETNWMDQLLKAKNQKGEMALVNHTTNLEKILEHDDSLGANVRFNVLRRKIEIVGGQFKGIEQETMPSKITNVIMDKYQLNLNRSDVESQLYLAASKRMYDPVLEYLDTLEWDGKPRIATALRHYFNAVGNSAYIDIISRKFFIAAMARALRPGCQVDTTLVLHGRQGGGKTTFVRELAKHPSDSPEGSRFHVETRLNIGDKDATMTATQNWLVELSELASIRGTDIEATRAFLTNREDQIRLPYARTMVNYPRRCIFIGTTNSNTPLVDSEGNRRFWTVTVGILNVLALRADVDQLWAEAKYCFQQYEKVEKDFEARKAWQWWLTADEQAISDEENEIYQTDSPKSEQVMNWVESKKNLPVEISAYQLAQELGYDSKSASEHNITMALNAAMKDLGWTRIRRTIAGRRLFAYKIPEETHKRKRLEEELVRQRGADTL